MNVLTNLLAVIKAIPYAGVSTEHYIDINATGASLELN